MRSSVTLLLVLAVALVALVACDDDVLPDGDPAPDVDDGDDPAAASTPAATYPLTGEPADDESVLERPVLAVKVDNAPNARPQEGVEHADVVMVETVEGATRFIALFHSRSADRVGPVRSGRFVDAELLPSLEPAFAISGAAEPVLRALGGRNLQLYEEGSAGAWTRDGSRPRPHNLFVATDPLFESGAQNNLPPAEQPWPYDNGDDATDRDLDLDTGREVDGADLSYPNADSVGWEWDGGEFVRTQAGQPHELASGDQVAAANVIIARMPDTGDETAPFDPIGSGELILLRDGREFTGTWEKNADTADFRWLDADGQPLPLAPGISWIELVPDSGSVTVHADGPAPGDADEDLDGDDDDPDGDGGDTQ